MHSKEIDVFSFLNIVSNKSNFKNKYPEILRWYCDSFKFLASKVHFISGHDNVYLNNNIIYQNNDLNPLIVSCFSKNIMSADLNDILKDSKVYTNKNNDGFYFSSIAVNLKEHEESFLICFVSDVEPSAESINWLYVIRDIFNQSLDIEKKSDYILQKESWYEEVDHILSLDVGYENKILLVLNYAKKVLVMPYAVIDRIDLHDNKIVNYLLDDVIRKDRSIESKFKLSYSNDLEGCISYYPYHLKRPFYYHDVSYTILDQDINNSVVKSYFGIQSFLSKTNVYIISFFSFDIRPVFFTSKEVDFVKYCSEVIKDLIALSEKEKQNRYENLKLENIISTIQEGVVVYDNKGILKYMNIVAQNMTGYIEGTWVNKSLCDILQIINLENGLPLFNEVRSLHDKNDVDNILLGKAVTLVRLDGTKLIVQITLGNHLDSDEALGYSLILKDITESKMLESKLEHHKKYDTLTGFINRDEFEDILLGALKSYEYNHKNYVLLYLDIDDFRVINDKFGHLAGDYLLKEISVVISNYFKREALISRIAGDEFAILIDFLNIKEVFDIANLMVEDCKNINFVWDGNSFPISVSVGIAEMNASHKNVTHLILEASSACQAAKKWGRGGVRICGDEDVKKALVRHDEIKWIYELDNAYNEDRIKVFYQKIDPITKNANYNLILVEILMRMIKVNGELVNPGLFIPLLERNNLMPKFDRYILNHIFKNFNLLTDYLKTKYFVASPQFSQPDFLFNINISGTTINEGNFVSYVLELTKLYPHVLPSQICFEITESIAIENLNKATNVVEELSKLGFQFALDDFGIGMSSFAYLKQLPVNFIKIDGKFIDNIHNDVIDQAIVEAILKTASILGMHTVAESVENEEIKLLLVKMGVEYGQGFHLNLPRKFDI